MGDHSNEQPLQALERFVVENDELSKLEARIGRFNIFDALGIVDKEIRHSHFLAWLLDPGESHGLGALFLNAVLMDLLRQTAPKDRLFSPIQLDGGELRGVKVRREWNRIDLLITCDDPSFVIAIENKINSTEHSNQLARYKKIVHETPELAKHTHRQFVYLTREGDEPSEEDWTVYSYADLHRVLTKVRATSGDQMGDDVRAFLDHYLRVIGSRFMDDEKIDELCQTIYKNHRQAIDLIVEHGSLSVPAYESIKELVEQSSSWEILHCTKKNIYSTLKSLTGFPIRRKRLRRGHEAWIVFNFIWYPNSCKLEIFIGKADDPVKRKTLIDYFLENQNKYQLKMPKNPGPDYTMLRSFKIGAWKEADPNEENYVRKASELMTECEGQFASLAEDLRPIIEQWQHES